jgi:uncharacterized protein (TIGR02996 family)
MAGDLIWCLNQQIKGWTMYHRHVANKGTRSEANPSAPRFRYNRKARQASISLEPGASATRGPLTVMSCRMAASGPSGWASPFHGTGGGNSMAKQRKRNGPRQMEDEAFIRTIQERPDDALSRLVYADWLEERGDLRGELIRIEEEMRNLRPWVDRFWQLKPRRDELRQKADATWLTSMAYGTDYQPIFRDYPDDWRSRWRLIRELVERWHGVPTGDVGRIAPRVHVTEENVGYELPAAVREWITFLDDLNKAQRWEIVFRDCWSLHEVENCSAFSLMVQGEDDYHWAVQKSNLAIADPPVDGYLLDYDSDDGAFVHDQFLSKNTTTWALLFILSYIDLGSRAGGFGFQRDLRAEELKAVKDAIPQGIVIEKSCILEGKNFIAVVDDNSCWGSSSLPRLRFNVRQAVDTKELPTIFNQLHGGASIRNRKMTFGGD